MALPQSRRRRLATFGGSIPAGLGQLAALQSLDLGANGLSGTIPADSARIASRPPPAPCLLIHWGDVAGLAERTRQHRMMQQAAAAVCAGARRNPELSSHAYTGGSYRADQGKGRERCGENVMFRAPDFPNAIAPHTVHCAQRSAHVHAVTDGRPGGRSSSAMPLLKLIMRAFCRAFLPAQSAACEPSRR